MAKRIPSDTLAIVAHTSGTTGIEVFENAGYRHGVFYPLQTFTKRVPLRYDVIPVYVEGCDEETENRLARLAGVISQNVRHADSGKRRALHVASHAISPTIYGPSPSNSSNPKGWNSEIWNHW